MRARRARGLALALCAWMAARDAAAVRISGADWKPSHVPAELGARAALSAPAVSAEAAAAASAAGALVTPALSWPLEDPARAQTVHAITASAEQFLINGKAAEDFAPARVWDGVAERTLAHPDDDSLVVRLFHDPRSMAGYELKQRELEALEPLSRAGAAPKLVEHGEAAVGGRGRVHFLVQEALRGTRLSEHPGRRPMKPVDALLERLRAAGLALSVPANGAEWLLSHIALGETPSGGPGAYLLGGRVERRDPESLRGHVSMLRALLTPSDELLALARRLISERDAAAASRAGAALLAELGSAPQDASPELRAALEKALGEYWKAYASRAVTYGYSYGGGKIKQVSRLNEGYMQTLPDGRKAGAERYTVLIDVYHKLLAARPDLFGPQDVQFLQAAFATPPLGADRDGDEAMLSELVKLAGVVESLALSRPDLMPLADYAALLQQSDRISPREHDSGEAEDSRYKAAVARLRGALDEGFHQVALTAPIDAARLATTVFATGSEGGRWKPIPGFEARVARLASARPAFARARLDPAVPLAAARREAARAAGDWADPSLHGMPDVTDELTFESAVLAAKSGWLAYRKAYDSAPAPSIADPKEFYARAFGLGQLFGAKTALGPKISLALVRREAREALAEQLAPGVRAEALDAFDAFWRRVHAVFARSANHARKAALTALLKASLDADPARVFAQALPQAEVADIERFRAGRQAEILAPMESAVRALLRDLDAGVPSDVAGVLLTGSYGYGTATPKSDLDFFILTRPGRARVEQAKAALAALGREKGWPPVVIPDYNVLPADSDRLRELRRGFPSIVFTNDAALRPEPADIERFDAPSAAELSADEPQRQRFRDVLRRRLQ